MRKAENFKGQKMIVLPQAIVNILKKNEFTRYLYITDIGYFPFARYHSINRGDGSSNNILIYCVDGRGWIKCNGIQKKIQKNHYYVIPAHAPHSYGADYNSPWTIYWIHFNGINAQHFIKPGEYPCFIPEKLNSRNDERIQLFEEMLLILENNLANTSLEYSSVLLTQYLGSLKYLVQFESRNALEKNHTIYRAISYMKSNIDKIISLQEVADHCNLSVSHFCLQFKNETSYSPMDYLTMIRIQKSCKLLCFTDKKVKEIACAVGYDDPYYFTRVFKKKMGHSPIQYRQHNGI